MGRNFGVALGARVWALGFSLMLALFVVLPASAAGTGKIQGKIVATDNGEPVSFADVVLLPADTTMHPVGGLTNADGTFLLEAPPGRYALKIRALSYATKRIEGIVIEAGKLLPMSTALTPEAIQIKEVVVEARALQNTESSMLSARKKAAAVGDAVSAEQVRKAPDKDAAEVLRRVTGLSVSDNKYVFVRGLGERYSSTEVDGVRLTSPEQNKRVVPLDLVPANLLENIVVQKTYTADRPGEFGGGDVQVHTKDFPGKRTWQIAALQGTLQGTTFHDHAVYPTGSLGYFGFSADSRKMPADVSGVQIPAYVPRNYATLASMAGSFSPRWGPKTSNADPNSGYSATYGDEFKIFGRSLGIIASGTASHSVREQDEIQRFYQGGSDAIVYDYNVTRSTESAQLGSLAGLSYRLSPRNTLHARAFYTHDSDDEVRFYEGADYNRFDVNNNPIHHRDTRFLYVERSVLSGSVDGQHELPVLLNSTFSWKFGRSISRRQQPDRREYIYDRAYYFPGDTAHWVFASLGNDDFGDLKENGWGTTLTEAVPYKLGGWGNGKLNLGYDRETKSRDNFYRRFQITPNSLVKRTELPVDTIFAPGGFDGSRNTGYVQDVTQNTAAVGLDNYTAAQRVEAGFVSADVPFGTKLRGNLGVRVEHGYQDVRSYALFQPDNVLAEGKLDNTDWLPSVNLTFALTGIVNLRAAASRTVSRPDLNELSPSANLEYVGGNLVKGNPDLHRATIDNYDLRLEAFPALSEVLAIGGFYKRLHDPIEQVIRGGTPHILQPFNSDGGHNIGAEVEVRSSLGRIMHRMKRLSINANASFISSEVQIQQQTTLLGSPRHPLQGQVNYLVNGGLGYATPSGRTDFSALLSMVGRQLVALGSTPLPDIYQRPYASVDVAANVTPLPDLRLKLAARNLLDPKFEQVQDNNVTSEYRTGRSYAIALVYGQ
ncbi:MAG TPA: TonB-dependent receptor [Candidatus Sulfotelmatobacter sp.]|nr:TonB-dependent receptor [Candidatus Sulfotelmatobacter sp.]